MFDLAHVELWIVFWIIVLLLLALDLFVFNRKAHRISIKEAAIWSVVWITLGLSFCLGIWWLLGREQALAYLTGYVVEKSLSVDNLFVFLVIFNYFGVKPEFQHRVLYWGVLGAIVLRTVLIISGAALVARFHWLLYLFGAFLVFTGVKLAFNKEEEQDLSGNIAVRIAKKLFPMSNEFHGQKFFVIEQGRRLATPMLLVLVTVELSDVMFAVDSIPAIFGITQDPFVILTSNIFAILGLRALYFLLSGIMDRFHYLQLGLSMVLTFIGVKMLVEPWVHIGTGLSLGVVAGILSLSVVASLLRSPKPKEP